MNNKGSLSGKIYPILCGLNFFLLIQITHGSLDKNLNYLTIYLAVTAISYYYFIQTYSDLFERFKWHLLSIFLVISTILSFFVKVYFINLILAMIFFYAYHFPSLNLRNIPYLKNACVAICWTLLTSSTNILTSEYSESISILASNFLIIFILSLLNDKIDASLDLIADHKNVYNIRSNKSLYYTILIISMILYIWLMTCVLSPKLLWFSVVLLITTSASLLHLNANSKPESFWLKFLIDLALIFHCLSLLYK